MELPTTAIRTTQRYAQKRDAILHAAAQLFNEQGIKGATLADVASRVGLSTNSITYYYKKKEDLIVACLLRSIELMNALIERANEEDSPRKRVRMLLSLYFERTAAIATGKAPEMMTFRDVQALGSPHAEIIYAAYNELFRSTRALLVGDELKMNERLTLNARAHLLLTLTVTSTRWSMRYDPLDYPLCAQQMSDILIDGLGAPGTAWSDSALDAQLVGVPESREGAQEAFLQAATELINEMGYRGASVDRISARLNVTKGAFYHHNPSKEELICACFDRSFSVTRAIQLAARNGEASGWERLGAVARALVRYQFSEHGPLLRVSLWSELPSDVRERKLRHITQIENRFASFLVEGMRDGSIRPLDQAIAAYMIGSMSNAAVTLSRWVPTITSEQAIQQFVRAMFQGLFADTSGKP